MPPDDLQKLIGNLKKIEGTQEVPVQELFSPAFMRKHTNHASFDEMLNKSGLKVETQEDLDGLSDEDLDQLAQEHTTFKSWDDLHSAAVEDYTVRQLGFT